MNFIKISYTGRIKDGKVFDTTSEEIAKKEGIYNEKGTYRPIPIVLGERQVIQGLDDALKEMKTGEEKTVEILPERAYGNRNPNLVKLVPLRIFKEQKINPVPGMPVELDGRIARIQTVAGGRVRVDFNSDLAGKTLVFNVKVEDIAKTDEEKIKYLIERNFGNDENFDIKISNKNLDISIPEKAYRDRNIVIKKASFTAEVFKYLDMDKIEFHEIWEKVKKNVEENY